ncbi:MAG: PHP domain-containing protein [Candidatus Thorarchaeota archaeon]|nr:PHP domain-containing protein [Candidatus Thorarchaeota archaeon]
MGPEKYDLHNHSDFSDGQASVRDIVKRATKLELNTIAITDHFWPCLGSRRTGPNHIEQRRDIIWNLRTVFKPLRILDGAEIDISSDGSHANISNSLDQFDLIIGSFHFTLDSTTWRSALGRAFTKWRFDILGHWDGYLTSFREEDGRAVAKLLADNDVAIELSARYETNHTVFLEIARDEGCEFTLGSDSHQLREVGVLENQIGLAKAMELPLKVIR